MKTAAFQAAVFLLTAALPLCAAALELKGETIQGGVVIGKAEPGSTVSLDGREIMVSPAGDFVLGFGRDETGEKTLTVQEPGGENSSLTFAVKKREYRIERVDGLPPKTVTPDPESLARIRKDAQLVGSARARRDDRADYVNGFIWPASGRISGVYGSQRVLNGEPRRPHFGVDIAAPTGHPVHAPAAGLVTMAEPDLYFSGGTIVLDHGQGLSSSFLHMSKVLVASGDVVRQGDVIGKIGATGRATGPHLDWRMNWLDKRVDPSVLVDGDPAPLPAAD
ncbi:MAG: M23 family metallopeptidase [Xanthomonadales bacterium]|nr:M23 family metallopeptidase [Xanthomonadales bacterium]